MIEEWSSKIEIPYNYFVQSTEMLHKTLLIGSTKQKAPSQLEDEYLDKPLSKINLEDQYQTIELKIQRIYQESDTTKWE